MFQRSLFIKESNVDLHFDMLSKSMVHIFQMSSAQQEDLLEDMKRDIEGFNQNKEPTHFVGEYAVLELLGAGAFGSVHKVKKRNGQSYHAMKEVSKELIERNQKLTSKHFHCWKEGNGAFLIHA